MKALITYLSADITRYVFSAIKQRNDTKTRKKNTATNASGGTIFQNLA